MGKKELLFLSIVMSIVFLGQFYIADRVLFGDDYIFATLAEENKFFFTENAHPPLPVWSDIIITEMLPLTSRTIRLTSIIFATLTIPLVYFLTKKIANQKAAIIATLIVGFSAWHIRASQMNSGSDGGMFTFFFYLTLYFFITVLETDRIKDKIATGIAFGLTMLSKETGVLLIPICATYYCYTIWKRKKETDFSIKTEITNGVRNASIIIFIALIVWSIFPIFDIIYNQSQSINAIVGRIDAAVIEKETNGSYNYWFMTLFSIFKLLIWTGPLLLFVPILIIMNREYKERQEILVLTILTSVLFYLIITPPNLDRTRYLMITIPALAILSAKYIAAKTEEWEFGKKECITIGILSIIFFSTFLFINQNNVIVSYESQENPIALLKEGNLNFSIPIFTETDNSGFLLHFGIFVLSYAITVLLGFILLITKNRTIRKTAFIIFLSISIGYNFIIAEEYGLHWTSPNYSDGIKEIIEYGQENQLKEPLYLLKNYELEWYLREKYTNFVSDYSISETNPAKIENLKQELAEHGGTIIFTDMPPLDKNGLLWQMITEHCIANYVVKDKGIEIGGVFKC